MKKDAKDLEDDPLKNFVMSELYVEDDLVVNEDGEELSEVAEESLPASMQRVLAQFAEEDVLDYMMARKSPEGKAARGTGLRGTGERGGDVGIKGITTEISLEESKIRRTVREAITKALKGRANKGV